MLGIFEICEAFQHDSRNVVLHRVFLERRHRDTPDRLIAAADIKL